MQHVLCGPTTTAEALTWITSLLYKVRELNIMHLGCSLGLLRLDHTLWVRLLDFRTSALWLKARDLLTCYDIFICAGVDTAST